MEKLSFVIVLVLLGNLIGCAAASKYEGYPIVMPLDRNVDMCTNVHTSYEFDPGKVAITVGISSDLEFNFDTAAVKEFEKCVWVSLFSRENLLSEISGNLTVRIWPVWFEDDDMDDVIKPEDRDEASVLTYGYEVVGQVRIEFFQGMGDRRMFTLDYGALKRMVKGYVRLQYSLDDLAGGERDQKSQSNRDLALQTSLVHALERLKAEFGEKKASADKAPRTRTRGAPY